MLHILAQVFLQCVWSCDERQPQTLQPSKLSAAQNPQTLGRRPIAVCTWSNPRLKACRWNYVWLERFVARPPTTDELSVCVCQNQARGCGCATGWNRSTSLYSSIDICLTCLSTICQSELELHAVLATQLTCNMDVYTLHSPQLMLLIVVNLGPNSWNLVTSLRSLIKLRCCLLCSTDIQYEQN